MSNISLIEKKLIHNRGIFNSKNEIILAKRINELTDKINELIKLVNKLQNENNKNQLYDTKKTNF